MASGYNAEILWVDLTEGRIEVKEPGEEMMRKYIGGAGLAAKILWEETSADTEPFAPENPLVFMTGPLTGVVRQSSRYIVAGISPLTNIWGRAHSGGDWADELRHSGFMGIVIKGKAQKPVYLWLHNGEAEICDASGLWGKDTYEVEELLRGETDERASVATIGRAGERLVRFAAIMNDGKKGRAAARCGLGALMGSKNLKAIVVRGNLKIPVFDEARLKKCTAKIYETCPKRKLDNVIDDYIEEIKLAFKTGAVPIKNWQGGAFDPADKFADDLRGAKMGYCRRCPYSDTESMYNANGERHVLWEHWGPVGTNCLIDNVEALQESFSLCQRYGLDCISTGGVLAFAMECYEKGFLTEKETGGIDLTWGNHQAMVEMVRKIGEREGLGRLLGEGVRRAAEQIGGIASEYAIHVKGLEFPMHDPRAAAGFAVQYATGSIGATHSEAQLSSYFIEDYLYVNPEDEQRLLEVLKEFGYSARLDRFETKGKGELVAKMQNFGAMLNSLVVCSFMLEYQRVRPSEFIELLNSVTGWDMDYKEFMKSGERICNLTRMFNVRRGISRKDDTLPARILTHKLAGTDAEYLPHLGVMLSDYYAYKGWSEEGIPTEEKLNELDLKECLT
ncbi:aldehyde ferredoxin oxidoreductase family protein [Thermodesulfobacteriota bacterium]